jgi:hypothetical protein
MHENDIPNILKIFEMIDEDWAFADQLDKVDSYALINSDRLQHDSFFPSKALMQSLESNEFISFCSERSDDRNKEREYMDFLDERIAIDFIYFFVLTNKAIEFRNDQSNEANKNG